MNLLFESHFQPRVLVFGERLEPLRLGGFLQGFSELAIHIRNFHFRYTGACSDISGTVTHLVLLFEGKNLGLELLDAKFGFGLVQVGL